MSLPGRLITVVLLLAAVNALGTVGYVVIEGWAPFDALYMTVITIASVGYGEVHPLSTAGRVFTIALILAGIGTVAYGLSAITAFWVEGDLSNLWEKRKMTRRIADLEDHVIVCGGGDTGRNVVEEMIKTGTPHVCVEINPAQEAALRRLGDRALFILGDATNEEVLREARVETARGLVVCMPSDKDNLFTILSAREMNPRLRIVSRVLSDESRPKLVKAGADAVVSGVRIGALRLASEMLRPNVVSVLDAMLRQTTSVRVEEIPVGAPLADRRLSDLRLQERTGVIVFAVRDPRTRQHEFNPPPDRRLREGDVLIACADTDQLATARRVALEG